MDDNIRAVRSQLLNGLFSVKSCLPPSHLITSKITPIGFSAPCYVYQLAQDVVLATSELLGCGVWSASTPNQGLNLPAYRAAYWQSDHCAVSVEDILAKNGVL